MGTLPMWTSTSARRSRSCATGSGPSWTEHVYPGRARGDARARRRGRARHAVPGDPRRDPRQGPRGRGSGTSSCRTSATAPGSTNWEYGMLCEEMGRSPAIAPMAFNCSAPDTGNMEILAEHGTDEQQEHWLAAAARRRDPQLLLDDRARGRRLGPDDPADARRARRRRVGHQRAQVVHLGRRRRRAGDRHVRDRPRRPPVRAGEHDPRAHRQPGLQPDPPGVR